MAETKTTKKSTTKTTPKSSAKTTTKNTTRTATKSSTASNNTATKSSTSKSTKRSSGLWGLNKTSFWCIGGMAILYLVASILALCGLSTKIILALQGLATAIAICLVACLAWRYVKNKPAVWKVLYVVFLLVVVLGIVIPLVK